MTLDDIRRVDSAGMYDAVRTFPKQWREGREIAIRADLQRIRREAYRQVVVVGMGGSAIGGEFLRALALDEASAPVFVSRSYALPAWVGPETVVMASSYSGDTEETLAAFEEALARKASVACVTSGGAMLERARAEGLPFVQVPGGMQPRAAFGYSLTALLTLAERMDLLTFDADSWDETLALLDKQAATLAAPEAPDNQALKLAEALKDRLPFIYSSEGLLEGVNLRWRNQIQENSKTLAAGNVFPELNHNEIMGWERRTAWHEHLGVVVLRDRGDHARVRRRMEVTRDLLAERAGFWREVHSLGASKLARVMSLVHLGDWVSLYLSVLHQIDPTPIPLINLLKRALQDSKFDAQISKI